MKCACTYSACPRQGNCRDCVAYHRDKDQFPACLFSAEAEKSHDRSLQMLLKDRGL